MKKTIAVIAVITMIGAVFTKTANSAVADKLVFPVLADNHNTAQNNEDPRSYGWYVNDKNGFGGYFPGNPIRPDYPYHPAEDWNRTDGRDNSGNEPVYSIGDGVIARIVPNNDTYGGTILIRYELKREMDFSSYFLPGTTAKELYRRGRYIIAQYMHVAVDGNLQKDQPISLGQRLGTIMSVYNGVKLQHLHFEIMIDPNGNYPASTARNLIGYYESRQGITEDGYIDPTRFVLGYNAIVGYYYDGFHADGTSQAFINAFNRYSPKIGWPVNSVHRWPDQGSYRVWLQDFQGDMSATHFGTDGQSAIILNSYLQPIKAYLVKEGMWGYYKLNDGPCALGEPFTEEIILRYANSQFNQGGDAATAGDTITVQKFMRVYDSGGQPAYNNERRTLIYNNSRSGNVVHFAVGEFSIGDDACVAGEQIYVLVDSNPVNDIAWPLNGVLTPTGRWFTKSGQYNFVRHQANGQRLSGWGVSAVINEGNEQTVSLTIATPANLAATAETSDSVRLTFTLPVGLAGYNVRVYQDGVKIADLPATESYLVSGLSPSAYYCFRVSAVDNGSSVESAKSAEACATTLINTGQGYEFDHLVLGLGVDVNNNSPIGETNVYYNSNQLVCAWFRVNNVYGVHNFEWRWYDPSGNLARSESLNSPDPASQGYQYWRWLGVYGWLSIASVNNYGTWQARIYIDDNLVAIKNFTLLSTVSFNRTIICKRVNDGSPAGETNVYFNADNQVYSWVELNHAYGVHQIRWQWLNPDGSLAGEDTNNTSRLGDQKYQAWCSLNLASQSNYGIWRVRINVDNNLTATDSFSLVVDSVISPPAQVATEVVIRYYPGPALSSPDRAAYLTNLLNHAITGASSFMDTNNPAFVNGRVNSLKVEDMTVSSTASLWRGSFNPSPVFATQRGGSTYYTIVIKNSQGIALHDFMIVQDSNDWYPAGTGRVLQNTLRASQDMANFDYDLWRPGFTAGGDRITSGSSTQIVTKVIIIGVCVSYTANTQAEYDNIAGYVRMQDPPFTITTRVSTGGNILAVQQWSVVSLPIAVTFHLARDGPSNLLVTVNGTTNSSYTVQTATNIMGPWTDYITVYNQTNGVSAFIVPNALSARFFR